MTAATTAAVKLAGLKTGVDDGSVAAVTVEYSATAAAKVVGVVAKRAFNSARNSMLFSSRRRLG